MKEPLNDPLDIAAQAYHRRQTDLAGARELLIGEIRKAARAGRRQVDIVKATGWTREQIRRVCRG